MSSTKIPFLPEKVTRRVQQIADRFLQSAKEHLEELSRQHSLFTEGFMTKKDNLKEIADSLTPETGAAANAETSDAKSLVQNLETVDPTAITKRNKIHTSLESIGLLEESAIVKESKRLFECSKAMLEKADEYVGNINLNEGTISYFKEKFALFRRE